MTSADEADQSSSHERKASGNHSLDPYSSDSNGKSLPAPETQKSLSMSTPHRGLPLPGPMALSDQHRVSHTLAPSQHSLGYAPVHAQHGLGREEERPTGDWYWAARAAEDKRKEEEERTRQESIKLEQLRQQGEMMKLQCEMLRASMDAGVPPHLLPMILAAMGGGAGSSAAQEMVQQYMVQLQQQNPQQPLQATTHMSPELRRENRSVANAQHGHFPQYTPISGAQTGSGSLGAVALYPSPAYHETGPLSRVLPPGSNGPSTSRDILKPSLAAVALPRLTTNEAMLPQPSTAQPPTFPHLHQERATPSPSIAFFHWQPPASQTSPSTKDPHKTSPNQPSNLSNSTTYEISPPKRKAHGGHQPNPPPTSALRGTSPTFSEKSFSSRRPTGHTRRGSDQTSRGYDPVGSAYRQGGSTRNSRQGSRRKSSVGDSRIPTKTTPPNPPPNREPYRTQTKSET